jgi:hypothetical protein
MNRLFSISNIPASPAPAGPEAASLLARSLREPSLLRLAQAIQELNPELARALCGDGLSTLNDASARAAWRERLASFLGDHGPKNDGGADDNEGNSPLPGPAAV